MDGYKYIDYGAPFKNVANADIKRACQDFGHHIASRTPQHITLNLSEVAVCRRRSTLRNVSRNVSRRRTLWNDSVEILSDTIGMFQPIRSSESEVHLAVV